MDAAAVVTVQDQLGELIGVRLRAETLDGTDLALADDPPPRLAFGAVLAHQQRDVVVEPQPDDAALASAGRLGRLLDVEATGLREVHEDARAAEVEDQVLAPPAGARERPADERLRRRVERLQARETDRLHCGEGSAADALLEPLGQRLHLGKLRHPIKVPGTDYAPFFAPTLSAYVAAPFVHDGPLPQLRRVRFFGASGSCRAQASSYSFMVR